MFNPLGFLFDRDKKKISVQIQTEKDCSSQFSVCLRVWIFCLSHLHPQPHPAHHCLGGCFSFKYKMNAYLLDRDKQKISNERQTKHGYSFQFSFCLQIFIFCLSLNVKYIRSLMSMCLKA